MSIKLSFDALGDRRFRAGQIALSPSGDVRTRSFLLRIAPQSDELSIAPGMSAQALIAFATDKSVIATPRDALLRQPDGRAIVWIVGETGESPVVSSREVIPGRAEGDSIRITSGLQAGEKIVVPGNESLLAGQPVRVVGHGSQHAALARYRHGPAHHCAAVRNAIMLEQIVRQSTLVTVCFLILSVVGVVAALQTPVQMIPDLDVRTISVRTQWPGASPQDIESEVLIEQKEFLRRVPNLSRLTAVAETGEATIELEFPFDTDVTAALLAVNNALNQVPAYPETVRRPQVVSSAFSRNSFMFFRISPLPGNPKTVDMDLIADFVDRNVRSRMESVPGVSNVGLCGSADRQIQIWLDRDALNDCGLTLSQVRDALRTRNRDFSAGDIDQGKRRYLLRTIGRFNDVQSLAGLILQRQGDAITRLGDVATVVLDHADTDSDGTAFMRMDEHHHRIALHQGPRDDLAAVGWQARNADELRNIAERLGAMGASVTWGDAIEARQCRVAEFIRLRDPNGIDTEIGWGALVQAERPFRSPLDMEGFEASDLGLGHIVLAVDDFEASMRFYRDGLGLRVSDFIDLDMGGADVTRVAFLHCGPRHHSIAIAQIGARKRLHHLMLQVQDMRDVGTAFDRCRDAVIPIAMELGCYTNDRRVSFYAQTPSGFQVEYGHGGREIDDDIWQVETYRAASIWGHRSPADSPAADA